MSTSSKVLKTNINKEKGYLYFLTPENEIMKLEISDEGRRNDALAVLVRRVDFRREDGFMYFIDQDGDISQVKVIV